VAADSNHEANDDPPRAVVKLTAAAVASVALLSLFAFMTRPENVGFYLLYLIPVTAATLAIIGGKPARLAVSVLRELNPGSRVARPDAALLRVARERSDIVKKTEQQEKEGLTPSALDNIRLSLNQLIEYYTINKAQARNSFRLSVVATILGLLTILGGIWLFFGTKDETIGGSITVAAGAVAELIGGSAFFLYNKTTKQLNYFYANLVRSQDTMLSVALSDQLESPHEVAEAKRKIINTLLRRTYLSPDDLKEAGQVTDDSPQADPLARTVGGPALELATATDEPSKFPTRDQPDSGGTNRVAVNG
jgi:hypothetical protein